MPLLTITTNIAVDTQKGFLEKVSKTAADILGKPEDYVMVHLQDSQAMSFAGNAAGTCLLNLKSLGMPEEKTQEFSEKLCNFIGEQLGISADRIYIEFANPPRHMWGYNKKTFG